MDTTLAAEQLDPTLTAEELAGARRRSSHMGTTEMQSTKTTYIARRDADSSVSKATSVQKK